MSEIFTLDFDEIFRAYVESTKTQFNIDRTLTVGASEAFNCMRQLALEKRHKEWGIAPDEDLPDWGAAQRGKIIENHHVVPALHHGLPTEIVLEFAGGEQNTLVLGRNSATPDGLFTGIPKGPVRIIAGGHVIDIPHVENGCIGLEIKSIDPRVTLEEEKKKHFGQTQIGLGIIRETTEWRPEHWLILYFDASFLSKMTPFLITYQPGVFKSAQQIATAIWQRDSLNDFEPEGKITGECDHCRWKTACGEAVLSQYHTQTQEKNKASPEVVAALDPVVTEWRQAEAELKEATERVARLKQDVKNALLAHGVRKVPHATGSVTWFTVKGKTTVNYKKAVEDHGIDPTPYETVGAGHDQLKFTPKSKE